MPTGVAVTATHAYVANAKSDDVSVVDLTLAPPAEVLKIPVGTFPVGVALSPDASEVYVTNYSASTLSIISTATNTVTHTVGVGTRPNGVVRVGTRVYVANLSSSSISVVDPVAGTVTGTIPLPGAAAPSGLAADAAGTRLYVSDSRNAKLITVDIASAPPAVLGTTSVGLRPAYVSVAGTTGYVANSGSNNVSVVNLAANPPTVTATVPVGTADYGIVAQPSLDQVLVTNSGSNDLSVIDTTTNTTVGTFPLGDTPNAIAVTPDGTTAVVSNQGANTVSVRHVNQRPVNTVPGAQTVNANGTGSSNNLVLSPANGNALSTSDDSGTNPVELTLSVDHGTLSIVVNGSTVTAPSITIATLDVTGLNAALANGVTYTPATGYVGADTLTMTVDDQGHTGIGKVQVDTDTVAIDVVNVAPVVGAVSFTGAVGNTTFGVGTAPAKPSTKVSGAGATVLANSSDPNNNPLTVLPGVLPTANGGSVTMKANGTFTYNPPGGFIGADTFTFTVSDGITTTNGTATINVVNRVWYVNNALGVNGNGTSSSPFNTLANLRGADPDQPGDVIFLYTGNASYTGGLPLEDDQRLIGQPENLVVNGATLWVGTGNNPVIANAGGAGITLAQGNTIRRVDVDGTSGAGITGTSIANADIGPNLKISNSTGTAFQLAGNAAGTIKMAGEIHHSTSGSRSVSIANRTGGSVTLSGYIVDLGGIALTSNTGAAIDFTGGMDVSSGANTAFSATGGGTVTVAASGSTLTTTTATALHVDNTTIGPGGLSFRSIDSNGGTNGIVLNNTGSLGGFSVTSGGMSDTGGLIQNKSGDGISLTNVGGPVFLKFMRTNAVAGTDVLVNGGGGNFTYRGRISNSAGRSVDVSNKTGGTVLFSFGPIADTGGGINLANNTGAIINFTSTLTLSTGTNPAFTATGGGTVTVTNAAGANTIATSTGTALNVQNTTIGLDGLNFQSISANGAPNGILLNNTGSSGGLTVTGTGAAGTGGTIQNTTNNGVRALNSANLKLSWMTIQNNGDALTEGGVRLTDVFGTGHLISSTVTGSFEDNVYISNSSGTLTSFTIQGPSCFIANNNTSSGNIGVGVFAAGTATMNVTVTNCGFSGNRTEALRADTADASNLTATFTNNIFTAGTGGANQGNIGINASSASTSTLTFDIQGNKIGTDGVTNAPLMNHGINVFAGGTSTATGKVLGNTIRMAGAGMSGTGIRVFQQDSGTINTKVDNNVVSNVGFDYGIDATDNGSGIGASTGKLNVAVTNNNVSVLSTAINAIHVRGRRDTTTCARITDNTATTNGGGAAVHLSQGATTAIVRFEIVPPPPLGALTDVQAQTELADLNPAATSAEAFSVSGNGITGVAVNTCTSIPT